MVVGGCQVLPYLEEFRTPLTEVFRVQGFPELSYRFQVFFRYSGKSSVDVFQCREIGEQGVRIHPVFVDIVEVRQKHIAPKIKAVEIFVRTRYMGIGFVQFYEEGGFIGYFVSRIPFREFPECHDFGHPYGLSHAFCQSFGEIESGSFIGKYYSDVLRISPESFDNIAGYEFYKGWHIG